MHLKQHPNRARGFSLIEVLVSLMVISIGLLGIAKMEALALSNTSGGRLRALAAIEAASLVSTIQAERSYWGNLTANLSITITGTPGTSAAVAGSTAFTSSDASLIATGATVTCGLPNTSSVQACTGSVDCTSTTTPCTAKKMAAYDVEMWAGRLQQVLNTDQVTITCTATTPPVSCQITITWTEATVNANAAETTAMAAPTYTIFVNP